MNKKGNDFIVFGAPRLGDDEINAVVDVIKSGWLGTGPKVHQFESDFKRYKSAINAVGVNSCTSALHLSYLAAGISPGDEIITTPLTFCATVNAIIHAGGIPVLADIDPITLNIDPAQILNKITAKTKAIVPVHFAGRPCDMDRIMVIAKNFNLKVIEDCAHAIETEYRGQKAGTIGDFGCFSFYSTKNIAMGEGGMVLSKDDADSEKIRILSLHGMDKDAWKRFGNEGFKHYQVTECGYKYNMIDLLAVIGIEQLKKVDEYWSIRSNIWGKYMNEFGPLRLGLPAPPDVNTRHGYHLFTLIMDDFNQRARDKFIEEMTNRGVGVGVHYLSLPEHPYYQAKFGWAPEDYPNAMMVGRSIVSIPLSAKLTENDVDRVISAVKEVA